MSSHCPGVQYSTSDIYSLTYIPQLRLLSEVNDNIMVSAMAHENDDAVYDEFKERLDQMDKDWSPHVRRFLNLADVVSDSLRYGYTQMSERRGGKLMSTDVFMNRLSHMVPSATSVPLEESHIILRSQLLEVSIHMFTLNMVGGPRQCRTTIPQGKLQPHVEIFASKLGYKLHRFPDDSTYSICRK